MDHPFFVRCFQRLGDLAAELEPLLDLYPSSRNSLGQRLAGNQFHHQIIHTVGLSQPMNRRDVRVIQRRQHSRFALQT